MKDLTTAGKALPPPAMPPTIASLVSDSGGTDAFLQRLVAFTQAANEFARMCQLYGSQDIRFVKEGIRPYTRSRPWQMAQLAPNQCVALVKLGYNTEREAAGWSLALKPGTEGWGWVRTNLLETAEEHLQRLADFPAGSAIERRTSAHSPNSFALVPKNGKGNVQMHDSHNSPRTSPSAQSFDDNESFSSMATSTLTDLAPTAPPSDTYENAAPAFLNTQEYLPASPRHDRFFLEDGNLLLHVGGTTLFNVHRSIFQKHSETFTNAYIVNSKPGQCVDMPHVSAVDLERLLAIFYPSYVTSHELKTADEWTSVLILSTFWDIPSIRDLAIGRLSTLLVDNPVERIFLARAVGWNVPAIVNLPSDPPVTAEVAAESHPTTHLGDSSSSSLPSASLPPPLDIKSIAPARHTLDILDWLSAAYSELFARKSMLTIDEASRLGMVDVLRVWEGQNQAKDKAIPVSTEDAAALQLQQLLRQKARRGLR